MPYHFNNYCVAILKTYSDRQGRWPSPRQILKSLERSSRKIPKHRIRERVYGNGGWWIGRACQSHCPKYQAQLGVEVLPAPTVPSRRHRKLRKGLEPPARVECGGDSTSKMQREGARSYHLKVPTCLVGFRKSTETMASETRALPVGPPVAQRGK